jgi:hypothetical protein
MASDYCDRTQLKAYLDMGTTAHSDDGLLDSLIRRASRGIDRFCRRWFYEWTDTREFDYPGRTKLYLDADLLGCTTLTIDGTANTDYKLRPQNVDAKQWIEMTYGSGSTFEWSDTPQDAITVLGEWGWHDDYANAWGSSGDTVQNTTEITAAGTALTVNDGANFAVRQTLKIESEQLLVTAVSGANLTVTRGINGTTAATHANATAISIYRPPYDIVHLAIRLAGWYYKQKDAPFGRTATPALGIVESPVAMPVDIQEALKQYRKVGL